MAYIYDLVDNWNNAGVTFTAIKMNVTDSNSAADSLLMDLQVGGASRFRIDKNGALNFLNILSQASPTIPSLSINAGSNTTGTTLSGVQITGTGGQFSCNATLLSVGQLVTISGTLGGTGSISSYANPTTYRISATNGSTTFTLVNNITYTAVTTTTGTPTGLTYIVHSPGISITQTWNNSNAAFLGFRFDFTDTSSGFDSEFLRLQSGFGGVAIRKSYDYFGTRIAPIVSTGGAILSIGATNTMLIFGGSLGGNSHAAVTNSTFILRPAMQFGFTNGTPGYSVILDTILTRRAAASLRLGAADTSASATITVTIASPGVVTWSSHGLTTGSPVVFSTTGALPTGITAATTYYVIAVDANTFRLATSFANALAGTAVNTSGSQSGTHTGRRGAIAQTLGVQDTLSTSSLENIDGADFVIRGSRGIGNKPGGSIVFQVAPAGSSGTAQGTLATALTIGSDRTVNINTSLSVGVGDSGIFSAGGVKIDNKTVYGSGIFLGWGGAPDWGAISEVNMLSTGFIGWGNGISTVDTRLYRDAANTLALRNANNGQTFRLYGRFTDITNNFERFFISAPTTSGAAVQLGTQKGATTGSARAIEFQTDSVTRMTIANTGNTTFANTVSVPSLVLPGSNSGIVTVQTAADAGTYTLTLPTDDGNAGQALITNGSGILSWAAGGTKSLTRFTPLDNQPPATNFATLDTRNSVATLDFDDGGTNEEAVFVGVIPEGATLTSGIKARIFWTATSATSGQVEWGAQFEKYGTDIDTDSFDTGTFANTVTSGTSGIVNLTEITCTTIDSLVAGDQFRLKIVRNSSDTTDDTMTGDAELIAVELQQVA